MNIFKSIKKKKELKQKRKAVKAINTSKGIAAGLKLLEYKSNEELEPTRKQYMELLRLVLYLSKMVDDVL